MDRKGFLFVVTVFLILTYILLSIRVWVKGVESSERIYSEFYKESNVELAIDQVTPSKLDGISNIVMSRALFVVNNESVHNPLKGGGTAGSANEFIYVNQAFRDFLSNGTLDKGCFASGQAPPGEYNSSLGRWVDNLNASLNSIGAYVEDFTVYGFDIKQTAVNRLDYSFSAHLTLRDKANQTSVSRIYKVANHINITGLPDPAIARASSEMTQGTKEGEQEISRLFFFSDRYKSPSSLVPTTVGAPTQGQGWFYGPVVSVADATTIPSSQRHSYILYGTHSSVVGLTGGISYYEFGAIILTNLPGSVTGCTDTAGAAKGTTHQNEQNTFYPITWSLDSSGVCQQGFDCTGGNCPGSPYSVFSGFGKSYGGVCPIYGTDSSGKTTVAPGNCVLFVTAYAPEDVQKAPSLKTSALNVMYDVEKLRDYTGCGYYTHSGKAPSYMQRLFKDAYSRSDSSYGIETFVIGEYANNSAITTVGPYSKVDRELFTAVAKDVTAIRGTAGCKDAQMCGASPEPSTGRFYLSKASIADYLGTASGMACSTMARCS